MDTTAGTGGAQGASDKKCMVRPRPCKVLGRDDEDSLRKCIRPLASELLLQSGHDEIRAHRSQIMVRAGARFFGRAYDTPIGCLVIFLEPRNPNCRNLRHGASALVVKSSRSCQDDPGDARYLSGKRDHHLVDVHSGLELA